MDCLQRLQRSGISHKLNAENKSTLKAGGRFAAELFPVTAADLKITSELLSDAPKSCIVGAQSNLLVADTGYSGIAVSCQKLKGIEVVGDRLYAGGGESLQKVLLCMANAGFSGLEQLAGIPCTIGGAVFQNAGAFGREMSDLVERVSIYDLKTSSYYFLSAEELSFSYRHTSLAPDRELILGVELRLADGNSDTILKTRSDILFKRGVLHPKQPSLGCTFKKCDGISAGKFIDEAGLKGTQIGGARVSDLHAGFIVNAADCTASDYLKLAEHVKTAVKQRFNKDLAYEIRVLN